MTSSLLEPSSIEKIFELDAHIGCAMSGLTADSRTIVDHARVEAQVKKMGDKGTQGVEGKRPYAQQASSAALGS